MQICKIVYVKEADKSGWRWQSVSMDGRQRASDQTYPLYYECVVAARTSGFTPSPALKCR